MNSFVKNIIIISVFLIFVLSKAIAFEGYASNFTCTKVSFANLRAMPSTSSSIVRNLKKFTPLQVIVTQKEWVKVKGINYEGWIFSELLSNDFNCMTLKSYTNPHCPGKAKLKRNHKFDEGYKILKKEVGCNYVVDRMNRRFWIDSVAAWPEQHSKTLNINL